jgi:hypothetical protein
MQSCPPRHAFCNRAPSGRQASRPATACRPLLTHSRRNSSVSSALSCTSNSIAARVYCVAYPHSFTTIHALSRRPTVQSTSHAFTSKQAQDNNHRRGLCEPIVLWLFLRVVRHLHLSLIRSHCCCEQSRPDLHPYAIAYSSPACAAHHPTFVILEGDFDDF